MSWTLETQPRDSWTLGPGLPHDLGRALREVCAFPAHSAGEAPPWGTRSSHTQQDTWATKDRPQWPSVPVFCIPGWSADSLDEFNPSVGRY